MDNFYKISEIASKSFINDWEKMRDFFALTKEEFLHSYSYLTENEYDATDDYYQWLTDIAYLEGEAYGKH